MNKKRIENKLSKTIISSGNFQDVIKNIEFKNNVDFPNKKDHKDNLFYAFFGLTSLLTAISVVTIIFVVSIKRDRRHSDRDPGTSISQTPGSENSVHIKIPSFMFNDQTYKYSYDVLQPISDTLIKKQIGETTVFDLETEELYKIEVYELDGHSTLECVGIKTSIEPGLFVYKSVL